MVNLSNRIHHICCSAMFFFTELSHLEEKGAIIAGNIIRETDKIAKAARLTHNPRLKVPQRKQRDCSNGQSVARLGGGTGRLILPKNWADDLTKVYLSPETMTVFGGRFTNNRRRDHLAWAAANGEKTMGELSG